MHRSIKGQALIEFAMAATMLVPFALLLVDACLIVCALQLNESTCREAARIASMGNPTLAFERARQIVLATPTNENSPFSLELVDAQTTVKKSQLNKLIPYGGQVSGVMKVTTAVTVRPVILAWFLGGGTQQLRFQTDQEFPCTYMMPNVSERTSL